MTVIDGQQTIYDQMNPGPTHGSLFSGYGGIDLALEEVFGARTMWVSDIDPGACTVLARRFPEAENLGDITQIPWGEVPRVDILSGGSPCQDLSAAGRRAGMTEGTRSNLWVQMREAIETLQPRLVVWENVMGALSAGATSELESIEGRVGGGSDGPVLRALGRVLGDLSEIGFDAEWATVRASDVGAPHGRARVFLIAWPSGYASPSDSLRSGSGGWASEPGPAGGDDEAVGSGSGGDGGGGDPRLTLLPTPVAQPSGNSPEEHLRKKPGRTRVTDLAIMAENDLLGSGGKLLPTPDSYAGSRGGSQHPEKRRAGGHAVSVADVAEHLTDFGQYTHAIERWERATGRPAPAPTKPSPKTGKPQLSAEFVEWMMGLPNGWFTDPELGLSRVHQLQLGGNGVVPQQAAHAVRGILARTEQAVAA